MTRGGVDAVDALIVGSGAGGGPLALVLSQAGLRVLVLEKGPRLGRRDFSTDEVGVLRRPSFAPDPEADPHTVVTARTAEPMRSTLGWTACCVGGGTVHMGGFLYRFHPDDFRLQSRLGPRLEIADWPYAYEDLEPFYTRAEWEVGVAGDAGPPILAGARSRPHPLPPLDAHPLAASLEQACRTRGLHPFATPRSVNSRPYQGRPACGYCDTCAGYGCRLGAKGSVPETLLGRAEATGRCEVRAGAMVRSITAGRGGRATGCVYADAGGNEREVAAGLVCVCCSAVESARLLLLSRSPRFPDGLANGSGRVGRHLQFHGVSGGLARFRRRDLPRLPLGSRHPFLGVSIMDHYFLPPATCEWPKGGLIRFDMSPLGPIATAEALALAGRTPLWGEPLRRKLRDHFQEMSTVEVEVFHDFLPNEGTYVTLDPVVRDPWDLPAARIHLEVPDHHRAAGGWVLDRAFEVLADLGAEDFLVTSRGGTCAYLAQGTCRAGRDPRISVLDEHCQAHEVPNLFVVDGSFMPTSGGAPPTLTILANAFRTARHIVERWKSRDLAARTARS